MNAEIDISNVRLYTERLLLRPWTQDDLDDLFEYASVPGVGEMAGWEHHADKWVSRTILDMAGAEKLVGKGDMLFNPLGSGKPIRVQGAFISDSEVNGVIDFVRSQVEETEYSEAVIDKIEQANVPDAEKGNTADMGDELLPEAIELVVSAGQASVSMLQRRFRIGYNRAARIVDMMEERQIIGPSEGSKPRKVLISEEDLQVMQEGAAGAADE